MAKKSGGADHRSAGTQATEWIAQSREGRGKAGPARDESDSLRPLVSPVAQVIHVVAHRHEEIEPQPAALLHLDLHGTAALERAAGSDDQRQIVGSHLRIRLRRMSISEPCRCQDRADLDAGPQALFPQRQSLEVRQLEAVGQAVDGGVLEDRRAAGKVGEVVVDFQGHAGVVAEAVLADGAGLGGGNRRRGMMRAPGRVGRCRGRDGGGGRRAILQHPAVLALVVGQLGRVVAFVHVFEHQREDLGVFFGQDQLPGFGVGHLVEVVSEGVQEEGAAAEDLGVGCEESGVWSDYESDDG